MSGRRSRAAWKRSRRLRGDPSGLARLSGQGRASAVLLLAGGAAVLGLVLTIGTVAADGVAG